MFTSHTKKWEEPYQIVIRTTSHRACTLQFICDPVSHPSSHQAKDEIESSNSTAAVNVDGVVGSGVGVDAANVEPSAANVPTKFTLTTDECCRVRELFAWLVEPSLAFLRREVSEMVCIKGKRLTEAIKRVRDKNASRECWRSVCGIKQTCVGSNKLSSV